MGHYTRAEQAVLHALGKLGETLETIDEPDHHLKALARRAALADALEELTAHAVAVARRRGYSWTEFGQALGVSKQAAQQRYGADSARRIAESERAFDPADGRT